MKIISREKVAANILLSLPLTPQLHLWPRHHLSKGCVNVLSNTDPYKFIAASLTSLLYSHLEVGRTLPDGGSSTIRTECFPNNFEVKHNTLEWIYCSSRAWV